MRLDKLLSNMGAGSRKEVKLLLKAGAIQVDGESFVIRNNMSMLSRNRF